MHWLEHLTYKWYCRTSTSVPYRPRLNWFFYRLWKRVHLAVAEEPKVALLDTAKTLKGKELDVWLESLTPKEIKDLWVQGVEALLKLLDSLVTAFEPEEE